MKMIEVQTELDRKPSFPYLGTVNGNGDTGSNASASSDGDSGLAHVDSSPGLCCAFEEYKPLHERINEKMEKGEKFFSLEFFPPKTANGVVNFFNRLDRFQDGGPLFVDVTWHMGSDPGNTKKETSSTSVAAGCLNFCSVDTMLHMTCAQYTKQETMKHLELAKAHGIRSILALRGDLPVDDENTLPIYQFRALDLVRWIKEEYGDYFTICVSGYPTGHPEAPSYEADLQYLKSKCEAGAHFVITQLFFESQTYINFVKDCRRIGITVPIIPGIMPVQSYDNIRRICQLSKLEIPNAVRDRLEPIKNDDQAVRNYGVELAEQLCRDVLNAGEFSAPGVHIYTLNREAASRAILDDLGLWRGTQTRQLPWKPNKNHHLRHKEDVRPIFWSARPKSYIFRTKDWDDFPNGRWGNSSSPAFGDLKDYYLFYLKGQKPKEELLKMWGYNLKDERDVWRVFTQFIDGKPNDNGVKVSILPWNEEYIATETQLLKDNLLWCNMNGILTVNSQPSVNGAPSEDPLVGWGEPGGFCYQKAYLEFFTSRAITDALLRIVNDLNATRTTPRVHYHMVDSTGTLDEDNSYSNQPIAVTWGIFPGREIAQPTVVDPNAFRTWKHEAYAEWINQWAKLYAVESDSYKVIKTIHDDYCLVTMVDNDFTTENILFKLLEQALASVRRSQ